MKIYLIHPVRQAAPQLVEDVTDYVARLEQSGHKVYFPLRDAPQQDPTGYAICQSHLVAMQEADYVHVVWDIESKGSHFDLGMAWALQKPLRLVRLIHPDHEGKSYVKVMREWQRKGKEKT